MLVIEKSTIFRKLLTTSLLRPISRRKALHIEAFRILNVIKANNGKIGRFITDRSLDPPLGSSRFVQTLIDIIKNPSFQIVKENSKSPHYTVKVNPTSNPKNIELNLDPTQFYTQYRFSEYELIIKIYKILKAQKGLRLELQKYLEDILKPYTGT